MKVQLLFWQFIYFMYSAIQQQQMQTHLDSNLNMQSWGLKDYMLQNYNNLINSDVICCQKWSR